MSEEDIRTYLSRRGGESPPSIAAPGAVRRRPPARPPEPETYKDFSATHLFCPTCQNAMPVREKIMLFLPDGDLYDYVCTSCGTSVGTRKA